MSCWEALSVPEKNTCFDAKSNPRRVFKLHAFSKVGAWEVQGPLLEEWLHVLPELIRVANEQNIREQLILKNQHHAASVLPVWSLFLVGRKARHDALTPTIVALHKDIEVAKRASAIFKELQDGLLSVLLKGYSFYHAEYAIKLCADPVIDFSSHQTTMDNAKYSLCGARVVIRSTATTDEGGQPKRTHSTIGGTINVGGKICAITTAHAFPHVGAIQDVSSRDGFEVYLHDSKDDQGKEDDARLSEASDGNRTIDLERVIHKSENRILFRWSDDIALIPIEQERFMTANVIELGDGEHFHIQGATSDRPQGPAIVASGVTKPSLAMLSSAPSAMLLPEVGKLELVWTLERKSAPGDCGSWVIDVDGRVFAMVVATSESEDLSFCLPFSKILADIIEQNGLKIGDPFDLNDDRPAHVSIKLEATRPFELSQHDNLISADALDEHISYDSDRRNSSVEIHPAPKENMLEDDILDASAPEQTYMEEGLLKHSNNSEKSTEASDGPEVHSKDATFVAPSNSPPLPIPAAQDITFDESVRKIDFGLDGDGAAKKHSGFGSWGKSWDFGSVRAKDKEKDGGDSHTDFGDNDPWSFGGTNLKKNTIMSSAFDFGNSSAAKKADEATNLIDSGVSVVAGGRMKSEQQLKGESDIPTGETNDETQTEHNRKRLPRSSTFQNASVEEDVEEEKIGPSFHVDVSADGPVGNLLVPSRAGNTVFSPSITSLRRIVSEHGYEYKVESAAEVDEGGKFMKEVELIVVKQALGENQIKALFEEAASVPGLVPFPKSITVTESIHTERPADHLPSTKTYSILLSTPPISSEIISEIKNDSPQVARALTPSQDQSKRDMNLDVEADPTAPSDHGVASIKERVKKKKKRSKGTRVDLDKDSVRRGVTPPAELSSESRASALKRQERRKKRIEARNQSVRPDAYDEPVHSESYVPPDWTSRPQTKPDVVENNAETAVDDYGVFGSSIDKEKENMGPKPEESVGATTDTVRNSATATDPSSSTALVRIGSSAAQDARTSSEHEKRASEPSMIESIMMRRRGPKRKSRARPERERRSSGQGYRRDDSSSSRGRSGSRKAELTMEDLPYEVRRRLDRLEELQTQTDAPKMTSAASAALPTPALPPARWEQETKSGVPYPSDRMAELQNLRNQEELTELRKQLETERQALERQLEREKLSKELDRSRGEFPGYEIDIRNRESTAETGVRDTGRISGTRVSRKQIDPISLDYYNVPWSWDPWDDFYILVQDQLTNARWSELYSHTRNLVREREQRAVQPSIIQRQGRFDNEIFDPEKKSTPHGVLVAAPGAERHERSRRGPVDRKETQERLAQDKQPSDSAQDSSALRESIAGACKLIDTDFEFRLRDVMWRDFIPLDFCDEIVRMHEQKEERKLFYRREAEIKALQLQEIKKSKAEEQRMYAEKAAEEAKMKAEAALRAAAERRRADELERAEYEAWKRDRSKKFDEQATSYETRNA